MKGVFIQSRISRKDFGTFQISVSHWAYALLLKKRVRCRIKEEPTSGKVSTSLGFLYKG